MTENEVVLVLSISKTMGRSIYVMGEDDLLYKPGRDQNPGTPKSRFEAARETILDRTSEYTERTSVALLTAGAKTDVCVPLTPMGKQGQKTLRSAVNALFYSQEKQYVLHKALSSAYSLLQNSTAANRKIILFSDNRISDSGFEQNEAMALATRIKESGIEIMAVCFAMGSSQQNVMGYMTLDIVTDCLNVFACSHGETTAYTNKIVQSVLAVRESPISAPKPIEPPKMVAQPVVQPTPAPKPQPPKSLRGQTTSNKDSSVLSVDGSLMRVDDANPLLIRVITDEDNINF